MIRLEKELRSQEKGNRQKAYIGGQLETTGTAVQPNSKRRVNCMRDLDELHHIRLFTLRLAHAARENHRAPLMNGNKLYRPPVSTRLFRLVAVREKDAGPIDFPISQN
ncbi:uncharacterized protein PGTG_16742 [Puccinia graminis f. sp. tritici CRL 75-36-700-3]|uniref:Uncharacterized protein n=1 Tax=Puccinia graminis f. sp. tritici (strain CRL 75-36-700-3 / race SCCL) TaxID=418459 RepID=E3L2C9_PUCGT|nr:uncharacterized protein PGTG_16742 [Puccinia graminis f. sp. tritici CRL 75-36-700-3]EFP90716.1 hypothetical protein PGTG_16742 [Puccinia graminis f. sp. tritici CRL 75-36-700-3]